MAALIRQQLPDVRIDWVARDVFAPLVRRASCVDSVFEFSRNGGVGGFLRLVGEIRARGRYDWVFDMQGLARSALMTIFAKGGRKIGRPDAREGAGLLVWRRVSRPPAEPAHAIERLLPFATAVGVEIPAELPPLQFAASTDDCGIPAQPYVVLFPESRRVEKEWPAFGRLGELLARALPNHTVVWSGTGRELPLPAGPQFRDLRAAIGLADVPQLIAGSDLVVANDSGPMHIAAAIRRPTVAVFGPTDPRLYGPWPIESPQHRVVVAEGGDLAGLSAEVVAEKCLDLLADDKVH